MFALFNRKPKQDDSDPITDMWFAAEERLDAYRIACVSIPERTAALAAYTSLLKHVPEGDSRAHILFAIDELHVSDEPYPQLDKVDEQLLLRHTLNTLLDKIKWLVTFTK